jgi:copper chaperone
MARVTINLTVHGMSCSHCENSVKKSVGALEGVDSVSVDLKSKKVSVEYDPDRVDPDAIKETIEDQGYDVEK